MPSPLGHALGGIGAGWLAGGRLPAGSGDEHRLAREALLFGLAGTLPDLDLLVGAHSTYTHSLGAVAIVAAVTALLTRGRHPRLVLGVAAAWASHVLLDWLGSDTSPPIGIMALWPFSDGFYQSSLFLFDAISRRYWLPQEFIWHNLRAAVGELVILAPLVYVARRLRSTGRG